MLEKDEKLCFQFWQILSDNRIVSFQAWSLNPKLKSSVHFSDLAYSLHFFPRKILSVLASLLMMFPHLYFWSLSNCFSIYTISISIVYWVYFLSSCLSGPSLIFPLSLLHFPVLYIQPQKNVWYVKEFSFSLWFSLSSPVVHRVLFSLSSDFAKCILLFPSPLLLLFLTNASLGQTMSAKTASAS